MSDPFGWSGFIQATEYWSLAEKNRLIPSLGTTLWINRLFWCSIAAASVAAVIAFYRFDFQRSTQSARKAGNRSESGVHSAATGEERPAAGHNFEPAPGQTEANGESVFQKLKSARALSIIRVDLRILKTTPFILLGSLGLLNYLNTLVIGLPPTFGFVPLATSTIVATATSSNVPLMMFLLMIYSTGELTWRDRSSGFSHLAGSFPLTPTEVIRARLCTLLLLLLLATLGVLLVGCAFQLFSGHGQPDLGVFLPVLTFTTIVPAVHWLCLGVFVQGLVPNRYTGYFVLLFVFVFSLLANQFGLEHRLFSFGGVPNAPYTDFGGYAHFLKPLLWYHGYWLLVDALLVVLAVMLWQGEQADRLLVRLKVLTRSLATRPPAARAGLFATVVATLVAGIVMVGAIIVHNTVTLRKLETRGSLISRAVAYERKYVQVARQSQPRVTAVDLDVDFYPNLLRLETGGVMTLRNKGTKAVHRVHVGLLGEGILQLELSGAVLEDKDAIHGHHVFAFTTPLLPGQEAQLRFRNVFQESGFGDRQANTQVLGNGSNINNAFINTARYFPNIGYNRFQQLNDASLREEYGLGTETTDKGAEGNNLVGGNADWIEFKATLSTAESQRAVSSGDMIEEWRSEGRYHARFEARVPVLNLYSFSSAQFKTRRIQADQAEVLLHHHPDHIANLAEIEDAVRVSFDTAVEQFGEYPYQQMQIVEFPNYRLQGQSYPGLLTLTAGFGMLQKHDPQAQIDFLTWVVSHEIGHQWWFNQLSPAQSPGATLLTESISQYLHLQVANKLFGEAYRDRVLEDQLARYLAGRGRESVLEYPLAANTDQVTADQPYVPYHKGTLALHAISTMLGVERFSAVFRDLMRAYRYSKSYPHAEELVDRLLAVANDEEDQQIRQWLNERVWYANAIESYSVSPEGNGSVRLDVVINSERHRDDGKGNLTPLPGVYPIELYARDANNVVIYTEKIMTNQGKHTVTLPLAVLPASLVLDPQWLLLEAERGDNTLELN